MSRGVALVTGASSGIGEALARELARRGFSLIITARREDRLRALAEELGRDVTVETIVCDLGRAGGARSLIERVDALPAQPDILVNNAGVAWRGEFVDFDEAELQSLIELNVAAVALLTRHYAAAMAQRGHGRILNVASVAAFQPVPSMSLYAASKAFVLSLSEGLHEELRDRGVSVTALCPGVTRTDTAEMPTRQMGEQLPFVVASAEQVAREGVDAMIGREAVRVPGIANQAALTWAKYQPRWLIRGIGGAVARMRSREGASRG